MSSEDNNDNNNITNDLRKIRKEKGLSLSDVSNKLKLTSGVISKLESSDFNSLGAYTYVRGYLNHYTDLLGLDSEKYIQLIPKSEIEVPLINTSSNVTKGIKLRRQSKNMANYLIGTFIVVAVSFSGWYLLKNYSKPKRNIEVLQSNSLEITPQTSIEIPQDNTNYNTLEKTEDTSTDESYHYSSLMPTTETDAKLADNEISIPAKQIEVEEVSTIAKLAYQIKIETDETSWVKVEHLDGTKVHNDLLKPGFVMLESDKPVHFRIGNEKKVKVTINGETIDLSKYSRKDIADFNWPLGS